MNNLPLTADQIALEAHLLAIEAKTKAWVAEDPANRWACYPVTEAAFWAEQGICSVADFTKYSLVSQVHESTHDLWHYKPDWSALMALTIPELQAEADRLSAEYQRQAAEKALEDAEEARGKAKEASYLQPKPQGWAIGELVHLGSSLLTGRTVTIEDPKGLLKA